ncbi:hypothetical protein [Sorangium cellulosum]|uniref:Uncharacterized protein n=1 Tax=Sorangium cellulosum So0157-2 TaxID=1254432 RepID=S4XUD3_SORCE|nr:hypothetical protein [Sorangium cellulosum]AGP34218.1 hypothetical protein SCE1572_06730 [Sorangium cellulosum So0157-2]
MILVIATLLLVIAGTRGDLERAARALGLGDAASERTQAKALANAPSHAPSRSRHRPDSAAAGAAGTPPEDAVDAPKVDVQKVEAALERFNLISSRITQEQLDTEQARMREANEKLSAVEAPEPEARNIVDDRGFRWIELTYPSGEVRYELPQ